MFNGKSVQTTISAVMTILGALSAIYAAWIAKDVDLAIKILCTTLVPAAYGLFKAKDKNVTGAGDTATTVKN